ncbi:MAG TPA: hypothetical protein V6D20_02385, partial [Candidatus Obscuribacterales bacterium]
AAIDLAKRARLCRLEAWTRDDAFTLQWYEAQSFQKVGSYLHVYLQREEVNRCFDSRISGLKPVHIFAQYHGNVAPAIQQRFKRVHECNRYDLMIQE